MTSNTDRQPVVLITGASSGIGKATAQTLLERGYVVYGAARRVDQMQDLVDRGGIALKMDVTKEADLHHVVSTIAEAHGGVDILINNAGFGLYGAMEDISIDEARYQFEVNLFGVARLTQLVLPGMRERRRGKIVNISSMGGKIYTPLGAWYHATKHALEGWSDCLRLELAPLGIDVIIIEPGMIQTEFADVLSEQLIARSADSAYADLTNALVEAGKRLSSDPNAASPPALIAAVIAKAVTTAKPRTRYVAGKMAKPLIALRKWFGDRAFDKAVMSQL